MKESNFHALEAFDGYEFYIIGGILKITHDETALRIGRNMVILAFGCLNDYK